MKSILKKAVSIILAVILCLSAFIAASATTAEGEVRDIWDGKTATQPTDGDGSSGNPYQISKPEHLAWMVTNGTTNTGKYYKLTKDIYLNDVSDGNWYEKSDLNQWFNTAILKKFIFNGNIDGGGHIVYGIFSQNNTEGAVMGLIPQMDSGSVKNVGVRKSRMTTTASKTGVAGIVGYSGNAQKITIDNCFADETVYISATGGGNAGAAGILGWSNGKSNSTTNVFVEITNCYSKAIVTAKSNLHNANGIIGLNGKSNTKVVDCYSFGIEPYCMNNADRMSFLVKNGVAKSEVLVDVYSDCAEYTVTDTQYSGNYNVVTANSMIGEAALNSMSGLDFANVYEIVENDTPKLKIFPTIVEDNEENGEEDEEEEVTGTRGENEWDGNFDKQLEGTGEQNDPYLVGNAGELAFVVKSGGEAGKYYKLTNDIVLNDMTKINKETGVVDSDYLAISWYSSDGVKPFIGAEFDGDGHVVSGIYSNFPGEFEGKNREGATALFPLLRYESDVAIAITIKNLGVSDSYLRDYSTAAGIVGWAGNDADLQLNLSNCFVEEDVVAISYYAGGIYGSGSIKVNVENCYSLAKLTANSGKAGLVANWWGGTGKELNVRGTFSNGKVCGNGSATNEDFVDNSNFDRKGATALDGTDGFAATVWYAVKNGDKYPMLRVRGITIRDIDENGIFEAEKELAAQRDLLLSENTVANNGDVNKDATLGIKDLVSLFNYTRKS